MKFLKLLAVSSVLFTLGCAQTPADGTAAEATAANDEGVTCVRNPDMGSRLDRKVCTTKAERAAAAQITKEEVTNRQRAGQATDPNGPAGLGN